MLKNNYPNGNKDIKRYRRYTAAKYVKGTREMIEHTRDIHGLRKCNTCFRPFNRDFNAARNMHSNFYNL